MILKFHPSMSKTIGMVGWQRSMLHSHMISRSSQVCDTFYKCLLLKLHNEGN